MIQTRKSRQAGFTIIEVIVILVVIGLLVAVGWAVFFRGKTSTGTNSSQSLVEWGFDGNEWKPNGTVAACENPLTIGAPMDVTKATAVLLPGEVRGGDFKPHGGMSADPSTDNKIDISTVRDAYLYRGARYTVEGGQTQYLFDFMDSCGVMFRFDHLATLTSTFAKYADQLPASKPDDSRTTVFSEHPFFAKGTLLATEVGIKKDKNVFFDLGVYDLRHRNAASKTDLYKTNKLRIDDKEQSFYALCWFDLLPTHERTIVRALPSRNGEPWQASDYCNK